MTVLQWERSLVVGPHPDGVQLLGGGFSSVLRGKGLYAATSWLQAVFSNPTPEVEVISGVADSQRTAVQSLIGSLIRCGALRVSPASTAGHEATSRKLEVTSDLPEDHPLLVAAEEAAHSLNTSHTRLSNSRQLHISAAQEKASELERRSYSVIEDPHGLWLLPPGLAKEDLVARRPVNDHPSGISYSVANLIPLMLVAAGDHHPSDRAAFYDCRTSEVSTHMLLPATARGWTVDDGDTDFSALSSRVCDDLVGPIGRPDEGSLQQLPLQVSIVRLGGMHRSSSALGTGMTLEDARVDAARRGLLWHSILTSMNNSTAKGSILSVRGQDQERFDLDPQRIRAHVARQARDRVLVGQPPGFAHESDKDAALAAAASSLLMAEHLEAHQDCVGARMAPDTSWAIESLELFSGNPVELYHITCAPIPTIAVKVSGTEAVYGAATTLSKAVEQGARQALLHLQSQLTGNGPIVVETRSLPHTVGEGAATGPTAREVTDILQVLLEQGAVVQLDLDEDAEVKRLFPNQIGLIRL